MRFAFALAPLACAMPALASAAILVEQAEIRPTLGGQATGAAYMTLRNTGKAPDRLTGAACACAAEVMAHRTVTSGGVSRMVMDMAVSVPAGGTTVFDARGLHLMLTGLKAPIKAGARVPIVLTFEKAGRVSAAFTATDLAGMAAMRGQHAH